MGREKSSKLHIFLLWILLVPAGSVYLYWNHPPVNPNWLAIFFFAVLSFLSIYATMNHRGRPVFLVLWLTIPAFLLYGVFVEMIIMQFAIIAFLITDKSGQSKWHPFFMNSTIVFLLSVVAAGSFFVAGGQIGSNSFWPTVFAVLAYQLTHSIVNDTLMNAFGLLRRDPWSFSTLEQALIMARIFVIIPLALSLYFLIKIVGLGAFLLLGTPYFLIMLIVRWYTDSEKSNYYLKNSGVIGKELSNLLDENEIMDRFVERISDLFSAEYAMLFDHQNNWLKLIRYKDHDRYVDVDFVPLAMGQGIAGKIMEKNRAAIYLSRDEWNYLAINRAPQDMQSLLGVPINRNQRLEAVLFLASKKKRAFNENQLKILELLCSYFTVSIEKARYLSEAQHVSERCALTKLFNFRYLEEQLDLEIMKIMEGEIADLSVVMIDIDYFKMVNDTYGHESGNEILQGLSRLLESSLPKNGIVGRYGGEEFVFILPGWTKVKTMQFAEQLRKEVAHHVFQVRSDLDERQQTLEVHITLSIGVASAPEDTDEAVALLRNADRALYIGAKQAGRNRVAAYQK